MWYLWVSAAFLHTYLAYAGPASLLPPTRDECQVLLDAYLLEKAVYELSYELNNRPDWVRIPLQGIRQLWERHRDSDCVQHCCSWGLCYEAYAARADSL